MSDIKQLIQELFDLKDDLNKDNLKEMKWKVRKLSILIQNELHITNTSKYMRTFVLCACYSFIDPGTALGVLDTNSKEDKDIDIITNWISEHNTMEDIRYNNDEDRPSTSMLEKEGIYYDSHDRKWYRNNKVVTFEPANSLGSIISLLDSKNESRTKNINIILHMMFVSNTGYSIFFDRIYK